MIEIIKEKNFLGNLTHIKRYSGTFLIKDETVSDHVWLMNHLAFSIVPEINKRIRENNSNVDLYLINELNLQEVIYRIAVHDLDESITFDIPRPFKYHNEQLTNELHKTVQSILTSKLDVELVTDINTAKNYDRREGYLVSLFDTLQAGLKMQQEIELGNKLFRSEIKNVVEMLNYKLEDLEAKKYDRVFTSSVKSLITEYIEEFSKYE